ncbi:hypothetical protein ACFVYN_23570, partial [Streptomyces sp. NPDC058307]
MRQQSRIPPEDLVRRLDWRLLKALRSRSEDGHVFRSRSGTRIPRPHLIIPEFLPIEGRAVMRKVLIANRGEIAVRVARA